MVGGCNVRGINCLPDAQGYSVQPGCTDHFQVILSVFQDMLAHFLGYTVRVLDSIVHVSGYTVRSQGCTVHVTGYNFDISGYIVHVLGHIVLGKQSLGIKCPVLF